MKPEEQELKIKKLEARLEAVEQLLVCYRLGKRPTEKLMTELDSTRKALAE